MTPQGEVSVFRPFFLQLRVDSLGRSEMPPRPAVPQVLKVEFLWSQAGIPMANVLYNLYSGTAPTPGAAAAIAHDLADAFTSTGVMAGYPESTILQTVRVTDLTTDTGSEGSYSVGVAGTDTGVAPTAGVCILVNHTISRRYRGGHPRTYLPGFTMDHLASPSTWDTTTVSDIGTAWAALVLEMSSFSESGCNGVYIVNVSYVTGDAPRVVPVVDQVTGFVVSGIVRSQRRRITASSY